MSEREPVDLTKDTMPPHADDEAVVLIQPTDGGKPYYKVVRDTEINNLKFLNDGASY